MSGNRKRTRAIRELMAQTGWTWTTAAREHDKRLAEAAGARVEETDPEGE